MRNKHGIKQLTNGYRAPEVSTQVQQFTATIHRNFRDTVTISPKVLLSNIYSNGKLVRDHMWVNYAELKAFIPNTTNTTYQISFSGKLTPYRTRGDEKQTIVSIHDIQLAKS